MARAVRRVAHEQIDKALAAIARSDTCSGASSGGGSNQAEAVHEVRRRCKALRGLVRLVRPVFPDYAHENAWFRDSARLIGSQRDAKVMQETGDALLIAADEAGARLDPALARALRAALATPSQPLLDKTVLASQLDECRQRLIEARERSAGWRIADGGFGAISGGLGANFHRARKAAARADKRGDAEALHGLRKQVKYHAMHMALLRPLWPDLIGARASCAKRLAAVLGDHHDLAVFLGWLETNGAALGPADDIAALAELGTRRMVRLSAKAARLSGRLLAEDETVLVAQVRALWKSWAQRSQFG